MKGNVSKIVSDKGAASEQYIDATVGTALKNSKEANENAQTALDYSEEALSKIVNSETAALQAVEKVGLHKTAPVLDHPDGSVTSKKLSGEVQYAIATAAEQSADALASAVEANATADSAKASADIAVKESENAYEKSLAAHEKASTAENIANTAKVKSETAEQRAISAETKADAAVASASSAVQKTENAQTELSKHSSDEDVHISAEEKENIYADIKEARDTAVHADVYASETCEHMYVVERTMENNFGYMDTLKADKPIITTSDDTTVSFEFSENHNKENRTGELNTISFTFGDGEYAEDYISGLSFNSGETPTAIDYTDSGILNWVGTDCVTSDGLSIFQPSANTHYDIVFYFNGVQFIGLVNGYVPATGNEAV